ncbi:MAG TPA: hypothetical protein PKZ76_03740 [Xanthomonadaceae bacterium]|nr:hypothetical protein [Xanthomonadaceae bacterium]
MDRQPQESEDRPHACVLACALASRADLIASGDGDLLALRSFQGIPIGNAAQALAIIQAAGP